jgi:hypothetical protein
MHDTIKRLYEATKDPSIVIAAVEKKGWITEEDYFKITGFVYPATSALQTE